MFYFFFHQFCDVVAQKNQVNVSDLQKNGVKIWWVEIFENNFCSLIWNFKCQFGNFGNNKNKKIKSTMDYYYFNMFKV